jgi:uncharacterized membrane protein YoaK (UPF0700 family)
MWTGEEMAASPRRRNINALTTGYVFISLAISILVAVAVGKIWYILPVFLLLIGVWVAFLGTLPRASVRGSPSARVYLMTWGIILVLVGGLLIINDLFPDNLPLLIAIFLIVIGLGAFATYATNQKRIR